MMMVYLVASDDQGSTRCCLTNWARNAQIDKTKGNGMAEWVRLCSKSDLPRVGDAREIEIGPRTVCVANHGGKIAVMQNECPHHGGPLGQGMVEGEKIICPWHAWAFDFESGLSSHLPQARVKVYEVAIEGDDVKINL